jgi:RND family efflux transporter MFP subunit
METAVVITQERTMVFHRLCALALLAGAACLAAPANAAEALKLSEAQIGSLGIETAAPVAASTGQLQGLPAQVVVPNDQLRVVSAPLPGLVEQIGVATQQVVRRGQPLLRLLSPGLADIQHTFLQAATQLELARTQLDRDEQLFAEGIIAESRLQATRARWIEVSADYAERMQALRLAGMSDSSIGELRRGRRVGSSVELLAPIEGVVLEQLAVVGQRVEASAPLLRIGRLDPLWLELQMPAARLADVREGATVRVPAANAEARVIAIGRNINAANQTVTVRALTTRGADRLLPGQQVEATLAAPAPGGQWSVPTASVVRLGDAAQVFVRTRDGFRLQPVSVVSEGTERTIVAGPLQPAEQVAFKGIAALKAAFTGTGAP